MTENKGNEDEKWKDGALLDKLLDQKIKDIFYNRLDDENDLLFIQELFKGNMHIRIFQSIEQTLIKNKGPLTTIDKFLEYADDGLFYPGWSKKLLQILRHSQFGKKQKLAEQIEPSDEEIEHFKKKCGRTGCRLLKLIEERYREDIETLRIKPEIAFRVYYNSTHINMIPNSGFRDLQDQGDSKGVADLLQMMQSNREKNSQDGPRLMVCNQDPRVPSSQIAKLFMHHALEKNMICLHYNWDEGQKSGAQCEEACPKFVIEKRLAGHNCQLNHKETARAYNYVVNHLDEVVVIIDGLHEKVNRKQGFTEDDWTDTALNHMCSLVLKNRLRGAYKVLIWNGDEMKQSIGQLLRSNLPDMYAVFGEQD